MRRGVIVGLIAPLMFAGMIHSAVGAAGDVKVYSNICYNNYTGDVLGTQITLLQMAAHEIYVIYGESDGSGPSTSIVDMVGPDYEKIRRGQLEFEGSTPFSAKEIFRGRITDKEIILSAGGFTTTGESNDTGNGPMHLRRVKLPVPFDPCKITKPPQQK